MTSTIAQFEFNLSNNDVPNLKQQAINTIIL